MARHLSVGTAIEKNRISSEVAFIVGLDIDVVDPSDKSVVETLYFVKNNETFTADGQAYQPANFDFKITEEAGALPSVSVSVQDVTRAIRQKMEQYGGGLGFNVIVTIFNTAAPNETPDLRETFKVTRSSTKDHTITWTLGAENPLLLRFPMRRQFRDRCSFKYKGTECGYVGGLATCDLSYAGTNGCTAHSNETRFGGFPALTGRGANFV